MKWAIRSGLLALFAILLAGNIKADTVYSYSLTGPGLTVAFNLPEFPAINPTLNNFFGDPIDGFFTVNPPDLKINGAPSSDTLAFVDAAMGGAFEDITNPMDPLFSLAGPQLYAGMPDETNPQMLIGTGTYTLCNFLDSNPDLSCPVPNPSALTLNVSIVPPMAAPEPSSLLLFGVGLSALVLMRKRYATN